MTKKSKQWFKAAGIRAMKTFCQAALGLLGTSMVLTDVDWLTVLSASALASLVSILTSLTGLPECKE